MSSSPSTKLGGPMEAMLESGVPLTLPANILGQAQTAAKRASALTGEDKGRLLEALRRYEPRTGSLMPDDIGDLAAEVRLDFRLVQDVFYLIYVLAQDRLASNADVVETLAPDVEDRPLVSSFLDELRPIAQQVSDRLDVHQSVEWAMPSFRDVFIANDLRALPDEDNKPLRLVPISVIKLVLNDGAPLIFQCLPGGMRKLLDALVEATETIEKLQEITERKS